MMGRCGESIIGALSSNVRREHVRSGQGRETALIQACEREMERVAPARGETLRLPISPSSAVWRGGRARERGRL